MVRLTALLSDAAERTDRTLPLAAVPLIVSLASLDKLRRVSAFDGVNLGVSFGFPSPVTAGWAFLSLPGGQQGASVSITPDDPPAFALVGVGTALLTAALGAGYLGSLRRAIADEPGAFLADVRAHVAPLAVFQAGVLAVTLPVVGLGLVSTPLLLVAVPALLAGAYLFYAAPYLVVTGDRPIAAALAASYSHATGGGDYAAFFLRYLAAVATLSVLATPPFTSLGLAGGLVGMAVLAPVGLLFDDATMAFVLELDAANGHPDDDPTSSPPFPAVRRIDGESDGAGATGSRSTASRAGTPDREG